MLLPKPVSQSCWSKRVRETAHQCSTEDIVLLVGRVSPADEPSHTRLLKGLFQHVGGPSAWFDIDMGTMVAVHGTTLRLSCVVELCLFRMT